MAIDFLTDVAAELPMQAICILLGVPEADRHELWEAVDPGFDIRAGDAGVRPVDPGAAQTRMVEYGAALIVAKRQHPEDDMLSIVVGARLPDLEPPMLSDGELYSFFSLLFAAGSETTRNAIAGGLAALIDRPDQLDALRPTSRCSPGHRGDVAVDHALAGQAEDGDPSGRARWPLDRSRRQSARLGGISQPGRAGVRPVDGL